MRSIFLSSFAILLATLLLIGCNSSTSQTTATTRPSPNTTVQTETTYADGARRITIADAQKLMKSGQAFFVDVRNQASYDAGHIPGAKLIPAGEILAHVDELPRNKTIITYCS